MKEWITEGGKFTTTDLGPQSLVAGSSNHQESRAKTTNLGGVQYSVHGGGIAVCTVVWSENVVSS